jgi:hypothetical protein
MTFGSHSDCPLLFFIAIKQIWKVGKVGKVGKEGKEGRLRE